jgi:hypothetical protein
VHNMVQRAAAKLTDLLADLLRSLHLDGLSSSQGCWVPTVLRKESNINGPTWRAIAIRNDATHLDIHPRHEFGGCSDQV